MPGKAYRHLLIASRDKHLKSSTSNGMTRRLQRKPRPMPFWHIAMAATTLQRLYVIGELPIKFAGYGVVYIAGHQALRRNAIERQDLSHGISRMW